MPGVTVLPNSPVLGGFPPAQSTPQNGSSSQYHNLTVAQIKLHVQDSTSKSARGVSTSSLLGTARPLILQGKEYENRGDLKGALVTFIKAATLAKLAMESVQQPDKNKSAWKEVYQFMDDEAKGLTERTTAIEEKLKAMEKTASRSNEPPDPPEEAPSGKSGTSIAERVRLLKTNGMNATTTISSTKRQARDFSTLSPLPTPPLSPTRPTAPGISPTPSLMSSLSASVPVSSASSPHAIVPPSSFGPPSPTSSPPSSPQISTSDFAKNFPSIEELNEDLASVFPSASIQKSPSSRYDDPTTPPAMLFRSYMIPTERPASTPITPIAGTFYSRPASPSRPAVPSKLSEGQQKPAHPGKAVLPFMTSVTSRDLRTRMRDHRVLLLDVRDRSDFDRSHIKSNEVVCVEPLVLARADLTAEKLEASMFHASEHSIFGNRDKFELVVAYDASSTEPSEGSSLSVLLRVIGDRQTTKLLRREPVFLVGGIKAWLQEFGEDGVEPSRISAPIAPRPQSYQTPTSSALLQSTLSPRTTFMNGSGSQIPLSAHDPHQIWTPPRSREDTESTSPEPQRPFSEHRPNLSLSHSGHSRTPAEVVHSGRQSPEKSLIRRSAMSRPPSNSISYPRTIDEHSNSFPLAQPLSNGFSTAPITYPSIPRSIGSGAMLNPASGPASITSPPQASINPSLSRRRSDFIDQSQEALSALPTRPSVDYPELGPSSPQAIRPPPPVAASALERIDRRPNGSNGLNGPPPRPKIMSEVSVSYWGDTEIGHSGLRNMGNTCYMNAPIQCLSATVPFAQFFTNGRWRSAVNVVNKLGSRGLLTSAFAALVQQMWKEDMLYFVPNEFRRMLCQLRSQYNNSDQHDSQEFLSFLLDGIHEDLNRVLSPPAWNRTAEQEAVLEAMAPQLASNQEWEAWKARNDSIIVDFFQGQFRNRMECLSCHQTSTTYNVFSILQLPIPHGKHNKVPIQHCLDAFFNEEVMEKDDAWDCPRCKTKQRASKKLSLARLPPVLVIHFKRFEANGRFSDKIDTFVDFPLKSLDLTNYMPSPLPPGVQKQQAPPAMDDPRTQLPPYKYDLYGVTNHTGNLSSGHYTAAVASKGSWLYCDDSTIKAMDPKHVVSQKAYVLFYKRVRA